MGECPPVFCRKASKRLLRDRLEVRHDTSLTLHDHIIAATHLLNEDSRTVSLDAYTRCVSHDVLHRLGAQSGGIRHAHRPMSRRSNLLSAANCVEGDSNSSSESSSAKHYAGSYKGFLPTLRYERRRIARIRNGRAALTQDRAERRI